MFSELPVNYNYNPGDLIFLKAYRKKLCNGNYCNEDIIIIMTDFSIRH
jgi:hypothetical protein